MKNFKLLSVILVLIVSLTSCEKDPIDWSNPPVNAKIKGEKITPSSNAWVPDTWEFIIESNQLNKLIKTPSFGGSTEVDVFNYSSGNIVSIEHYTSQNEFKGEAVFSYNSSNLVESIISYNAENKITNSRYFDYSDPNYIEETSNLHDDTEAISYTVIFYKKIVNGNVLESFDSNNYQVNTYTYDNKRNIFTDLNNLNDLVLYYSATGYRVNANNKLNVTSVFNYNGTVLDTRTTVFSNNYDDSNRIIQSISSGADGTKEVFTY